MKNIDQALRRIASNLWFEWSSDANKLFRRMSPYVWGLFRRNLYRFLKLQDENPWTYRYRLTELLIDYEFMRLFHKVDRDFRDYMAPKSTWVSAHCPELADKTLAYLSMEYGFDVFPIYSGGLGVLSGDHLRGASDLGLKMVGVGLFYLQGYYEQQVGLDDAMKVIYEPIVPAGKPVTDYLPFEAVKCKGSQEDLVLDIRIKDRMVKACVWRVKIGRVEMLLLDTNVRDNTVHDRHITRRLYSSQRHYEEERQRRLEQEILLGIGGVRVLKEAGYDIAAYHLNEGHVALSALEVLRQTMASESIGFKEALVRAGMRMGFTTHTPIPEGNERFEEQLARSHLEPYLDTFLQKEEREHIFNLARNRENMFDMTKFALLTATAYRNGVSRIHGEVCRKMWSFLWDDNDPDGNKAPIGSITNAVHVPYWQKPEIGRLIRDRGGLEGLGMVEDETLWFLHMDYKRKLQEKIREKLAIQLLRENCEAQEIQQRTSDLLDLNGFWIGFARRFAEYKRVTLFLDDEERIFQFMESVYRKYGRPLHLIYAGKPHPNNYPGRARLQRIGQVAKRLQERCRQRDFKGRIIFIQGYDIHLARYLEAGVDIWLNNPIRPLEACGTSGMKAAMNGVLNVSIPDGWAPEGIVSGENGWLFGSGDGTKPHEDREALYRLLEEKVLPKYFERRNPEDTFSSSWVTMMKRSIQTITAQFNTGRMLKEYIENMYLPSIQGRDREAQTANRET